MIAEFYIIAESFEQNALLTIQEIEVKARLFAIDFEHIRRYRDTNKLFVETVKFK
jgi:hypothetical protein